MHAIHAIFSPPDITGRDGGKDSISKKKLLKGDARFKTTEELLCFEFMGATGTGRQVGMREATKIKYSDHTWFHNTCGVSSTARKTGICNQLHSMTTRIYDSAEPGNGIQSYLPEKPREPVETLKCHRHL